MRLTIEMDKPISCCGCRFCIDDEFARYCALLPYCDGVEYVEHSAANDAVDERCPFNKSEIIVLNNT